MQESIAFEITQSVWLFLFFGFAFLLGFLHFLDVFAFLYKLKMLCFCPYYGSCNKIAVINVIFRFSIQVENAVFLSLP